MAPQFLDVQSNQHVYAVKSISSVSRVNHSRLVGQPEIINFNYVIVLAIAEAPRMIVHFCYNIK